MASSLSLVSSGPDPEQNLPRASDGPQVLEIPAQNLPAVEASEPLPSNPPTAGIPAASEDVLSLLQRTMSDGSKPPDAVIRATAEAARLLTGADGVAIAFRTKGVISCRARSGDLAPDLGSSVNANSGISGECLRTASILVCEDARTDTRVDTLACKSMGIRSIVVVPLRGPVGISGILEVFSARSNAFGNREINSLRGLAELAEAAYERERRAQQEATRAALRSAQRLPALLARAVTSEAAYSTGEFRQLEGQTSDERPERLLWAIGAAAAALLLIAGVWLSWRGPVSELADLEAAATRSTVAQAASPVKEVTSLPKPGAGIVHADGPKKAVAPKVLRLNADTSSTNQPPDSPVGSNIKARTAAEVISTEANSASTLEAPQVLIESAHSGGQFANLLAAPRALPVMSAPISHGVTQGELIHKVDPAYPLSARMEHITGSVVLEIHVAETGLVRNVRMVSGNPQFMNAAVEAVRQWRYAPTLLDGHPIEATKQITILFKIP